MKMPEARKRKMASPVRCIKSENADVDLIT